MATARQVHELQELDMALDELRARLKSLEARLGDRSSLDAALKGVEEQRRRARDLRLKQRSQDVEVSALRERLRETEGRLYGGSVTNPRDLEGLQREQATLRERVGRAEEALLELMMALEEAQAALSRQEAGFPGLEQGWRNEQADLIQQAGQLHGEIESLLARRATVAGALAPQEVALYGRLRASRGGVAVAMVERAVCGGCRVSLPTHLVQRARLGRELTFCPSCGRVLMVN